MKKQKKEFVLYYFLLGLGMLFVILAGSEKFSVALQKIFYLISGMFYGFTLAMYISWLIQLKGGK